MFSFSKLNHAISALWQPREQTSKKCSPAPSAVASSASELSEDGSPASTSKTNERSYEIPSQEWDTTGAVAPGTTDFPTPNLSNPSKAAGSQLLTPIASSLKQEHTNNAKYLPPSVEDATDEESGQLTSVLSLRLKSSNLANAGHHLPTPTTFKHEKERRLDTVDVPLKVEENSDNGLDGLDGPTLVEDESSSLRRPTRKRKRASDSDPAFSMSSELQNSTDSEMDNTLVEKSKKKTRAKSKSRGGFKIPRRRFTGPQPGLIPGTWLEVDAECSEGEFSKGFVRHNTPVLESDDEMSMVSSRPSTRSRKRRNSSSYDDSYRPSSKVLNKDLIGSIVKLEANDSDLSSEDTWTGKDSIWKNDRKEVAFDFSVEKAKRWADAVHLPQGHWAEAEKDLFFRLSMRGFEPLVPDNWHLDFPTLPDSLFAVQDGPEPLIQALEGSEFRAIKFLNDLLSLGCRVRDRISMQLRPQPIIKRTIKRYIDWAVRDAHIDNRPYAIPVYTIYSMNNGESTRVAIENLNKRLILIGKEYRQAFEKGFVSYSDGFKFPVLTGFLICGPIVAVIALDSDPAIYPDLSSDAGCKFISQFDFGEDGQDVWNGLAVAITVMRIRKTMLEMVEEGRGGWLWSARDSKPGHGDEDL